MRRKVCLLLVVSVCAVLCGGILARVAEASQLIRIGYTNNYPSVVENLPNESLRGFGVDYLREVSSRTFWRYKYVECRSTDEAVQLLHNGGLDMVIVGELSQAEQEQLVLSDLMARGYIYLYTKKENSDWYFNDLDKLNNKTIGYFADNVEAERLQEYLHTHSIDTAGLKEYSNQTALENALQKGEISALFLQDIQPDVRFREIGYANGDSLRMAAAIGNDQLISRFDGAVDELEQLNRGLTSQLLLQNKADSMEMACPLFTKEEVEYIKAHPVITTASFANHPPFSWYDERSGQMNGIYEEILKEISKVSGLEFIIQPITETIRPYDVLKTGQYDLFAGVVRTNKFVESDEINVSDAFLFTDLGIVARKDAEIDWHNRVKIAVPQHFQALQEFLEQQDYEYVWVKDNEDAFRAVADGSADILMLNEYSIDYWLQRPEYYGMHVIPTTVRTFRERPAFATRGTMDPRLISILNKSIAVIGIENIARNIVVRAIANPYQPTMADILHRHKAEIAVIVVLMLIGTAGVVILCKRHHKQQEKNA